jgi:hypothetical protein
LAPRDAHGREESQAASLALRDRQSEQDHGLKSYAVYLYTFQVDLQTPTKGHRLHLGGVDF